jgi:hypothetical protein
MRKIDVVKRKDGTTVSNIVNWICKKNITSMVRFYNDMALYHAQEQAKYEFLRNKVNEEIIITMEK